MAIIRKGDKKAKNELVMRSKKNDKTEKQRPHLKSEMSLEELTVGL